MRRMKITAVVLGLAGVALTGCNSTKSALGLNKVVPDEFKVITKAPLVVPPDYALRPPTPGEPRPQELQPESAARETLLGQRESAARSEGERLFVARAGAEKADPLARYVVDDEFGDIAYKDKSFADRVMFWKKDKPATATPLAADVKPAEDPEQAQITKLIGEGKIVIQQKKDSKLKLPGL
jgi:hypothetical protein